MFEDESTVIPDLPSQREVERETLFESDSKFEDLNLHSYLNGNLKVIFGHEKPTMVQIKAIPPIQAGKDTLIRSQTGSGKVFMFFALDITRRHSIISSFLVWLAAGGG